MSHLSIPPDLNPYFIAAIETSLTRLQQSRLTYDDSCYRLTLCLHPFDINHQTTTTTQIVSIKLTEILKTMENLRKNHKLKDPRNGIRNLKNQIPLSQETITSSSVSLMTDWYPVPLFLASAFAHSTILGCSRIWVDLYFSPSLLGGRPILFPWLLSLFDTSHSLPTLSVML